MDQNERQIIDDLFGKIRRVESDAPPRDAEAEAQIRQHVAAQPAAPYYMAQAIVVQEQALAVTQTRVQELERQLAKRPAGGGFLSGLFGGGQDGAERPSRPTPRSAQPGFGRHHQHRAGGGFMAGAMQTALGVAGGVLIASALTDAFAPDEAAAGEAADVPPEDVDAGAGGEEFGGEDLGGFEEF